MTVKLAIEEKVLSEISAYKPQVGCEKEKKVEF